VVFDTLVWLVFERLQAFSDDVLGLRFKFNQESEESDEVDESADCDHGGMRVIAYHVYQVCGQ
jgi:hypothetical protein